MKKTFRDRINFLIKFDPSLALKEQTGPGITAFGYTPPAPVDPNEELKKYPNYCSHPEKTVLPGKNEVGVMGLEAIPQGYCCYKTPMPSSKKGGTSYIFLPYDAEIEFWDETKYEFLLTKKLKFPKEKAVKFFDYYNKVFPYDSVFSFSISGLTYSSWAKHERGSDFWMFNWYFTDNKEKKPYPKITWTDPRNEYDKIIDEWGTTTQILTSLAFAVAGFFTEGGTWLLLAEMFTEGTLGIAMAERNLEKGDNINASLEVILALTPWLKTQNWFRGVSKIEITDLLNNMRKSGLTKNSKPNEVFNWYMGLNDVQKLTWSKMLKGADELSESKIKSVFSEGTKSIKEFFTSNPDSLKKIPWYKLVGTKEFGVGIFLSVMSILAEISYGSELNDLEKKKLNTIYNNASQVSDELANEVQLNFINNAKNIKEIINSDEAENLLKDIGQSAGGKIAEYLNSKYKNMFEKNGGTWTETEGTIEPLPTEKIDDETLNNLKKEGYKLEREMTDSDWNSNPCCPRDINGDIYWKLKDI